jgi:hypothetical protein
MLGSRHAPANADVAWFWSITTYVEPRSGLRTSGTTGTLDAAKAAFRATWEQWQSWAAKTGFNSGAGSSACYRRIADSAARRHSPSHRLKQWRSLRGLPAAHVVEWLRVTLVTLRQRFVRRCQLPLFDLDQNLGCLLLAQGARH